MSKYEVLLNKVDEIAKEAEILLRDVHVGESAVALLESKKLGLSRDIVELENNLKMLKEVNSEVNVKLREKQNEQERLTNIAKGKLAEANTQEAIAKKLIENLKADKDALDKQVALYNAKNSDINRRQNEADVSIKKAQDLMNAYEKRVRESNLEEREDRINVMMESATKMRNEAKVSEEMARNMLAEAEKIKGKLSADKAVNNETRNRLENIENELKKRELALESEKAELAKQRLEVEYLQLKVNKIIKEKNIADLLNA